MNVKKKAQELADAIMTSQEFKKLEEARATIEDHEAAKIMLRDFTEKQQELVQQQQQGTPASEEQQDEVRKLYEVMSLNPYVRSLLEAEFAFSGMMMEVQEILSKPFAKEEDQQVEAGEEQVEPTKKSKGSKLWVPGK